MGRRKESGKQDPFLWAQHTGTWVLLHLAGAKVASEGVAAGEAGETVRHQVLEGSLGASQEPALYSESPWCLQRSRRRKWM